MPRVRARIAAGISVAIWKSAVLRAWWGRIPSWFRRWVSWPLGALDNEPVDLAGRQGDAPFVQ
ncbi:hypothetical protein ADL06_25815 [Streptomyces sp. NRRL F-6491]|nr:hypothetical protein ADL06_25815 [Streptomyces sp. NRRL F-6491]KOX40286.1 hypothetical protein ADL08_22620 [Streptomyces sp. NRRL F-6492]